LDSHFREDIGIQIESLKRNLKDHIFNLNKRNIKVLDPNLGLRGLEPSETWAADPVNILELVACKVVDGAILMASNFGNSNNNSGWRDNLRGRGR
jgi:hypothetical protein